MKNQPNRTLAPLIIRFGELYVTVTGINPLSATIDIVISWILISTSTPAHNCRNNADSQACLSAFHSVDTIRISFRNASAKYSPAPLPALSAWIGHP
jgi:hypothetical protein